MVSRDWIRLGFGAVLWVLASLPLLFWWMDQQDPGAAIGVAASLRRFAWVALWFILGIGVVALLLYPPFLPNARLWLRDLKGRMGVDRGPMLQALSRMEHHETSDDHHLIAQVLLQTGDPARAFQHATRAVEVDPASLKAHFLLGKILQRVKNYSDAAQVYNTVVAADPNYSFGEATLRLGECLTICKQDAMARAVLERHQRDHGPDRRVMVLLARLAGRRGESDLRRQLLRAATNPLIEGEHLPLENALARARARVALWTAGGKRVAEEETS